MPDGFFIDPQFPAILVNSEVQKVAARSSSWRAEAYGIIHMRVVPSTPSHTAILHSFSRRLHPSPGESQVTISPALSVRTVWDQQRFPQGEAFFGTHVDHPAGTVIQCSEPNRLKFAHPRARFFTTVSSALKIQSSHQSRWCGTRACTSSATFSLCFFAS